MFPYTFPPSSTRPFSTCPSPFRSSRAWIPLALAAWSCALLVGCGGGEPAPEPSASAPPAPAGEAVEPTDQDWVQWRGNRRDGTSPWTGVADSWPENGPAEAWRRPIGNGFSGLVVKGSALFGTWVDQAEEALFRLDADTGEERWRLALDPEFEEEYGNGPRSTPAVDEYGRVYALSSRARLYAVTAEGEELWTVNLFDRFGAGDFDRGYASSPLVDGDRLILQVGPRPRGAVVALDRRDGQVLWSTLGGRAAAGSPTPVEIGDRSQVLVTVAQGLASLAPEDGSVLWRFPWATKYGLNIASPVFVPPDGVMISAGYNQGAALVRATPGDGGWSVEEVWQQKKFRNHFNSSVLFGDHVFGFDNAFLAAVDVHTGELKWKARGYGKGSLVLVDGKLLVLSDQGELALVRATGDGHEELARAEVTSDRCWTAPVLARGRVYVRCQSELVALDLPRVAEAD